MATPNDGGVLFCVLVLAPLKAIIQCIRRFCGWQRHAAKCLSLR